MSQFENIDLGILKKFDRPGPRYTSYPTAPAFTSAFGPDDYRREIQRTNSERSADDLSIYVHLPFCDTLCYFCGCTMLVTRHRSRIREYNEYLKKEIDLVAPMIAPGRRVVQLHWGGGTPSYLDPDEIADLGRHIRKHFTFAEDIEASVEIDPRGLTRDHMAAFREVGFNRVSMGVQDFDPAVQEAVNRLQGESITRDAVRWSRELGFSSINVDLIYGLPFQTVDAFARTVEIIIGISPDRIAVFNYAHVPWLKPHQKVMSVDALPSPDDKLRIFKMTIEKLLAAGYWNIGMDHFARSTDELAVAQRNKTLYRNFQGYSTKAGCDLYGFGMSAIGHFRDSYHQNFKELPRYYEAIGAGSLATHVGYRMTPDDHIRKEVVMRLMCDMEVDKRSVEEKFGIEFDRYFSSSLPRLEPFIADGLVRVDRDRIEVRGLGRLVIRNIAMCFDAYIERLMKEKPIFSRTV
jgi:oxygen-independent coproporphyrinogen-3 oxidase